MLQAVESNFEPHQFVVTDLLYDFDCARRLVFGNHLANFLFAPLNTLWFPADDALPRMRRVGIRQKQEGPRFGGGGVVEFPERRCAVSGRTFSSVRQYVDPEAVGKIVVLVR